MKNDYEKQLNDAINKIIRSKSPKKLIVAGPGTGKTTFFRTILEKGVEGGSDDHIVLTFLNNLKDELNEKLSDLSKVYTFHGYCHALLRKYSDIREGLTEDFIYYPGLASLIKRDWEVAYEGESPKFVNFMRDALNNEFTEFYMVRSNYYDAIEFDDSVFRVYEALSNYQDLIESFEIVLVDEYQDFNRLEASFIDLLASRNPIIIVGDDDQALYSQLRGASHEFIRNLHKNGEYEHFELPFCMRCPEVIVNAIDDLIQKAREKGNLPGRIKKPYLYYPPRKSGDSDRYPRINLVTTSTQKKSANYMGKYIAQSIKRILPEDIAESRKENYPTALIIGPKQYLSQVNEYLTNEGFKIDKKEEGATSDLQRTDGLRYLRNNIHSNLGWRILIEADDPSFKAGVIIQSVKNIIALYKIMPDDYRTKIQKEVAQFTESILAVEAPITSEDTIPIIKATSFEGSKGLSAQHIYILGLHEGQLPRDALHINDLEICKFIVALTRTRKECNIICTSHFAGIKKKRSIFLDWIKPDRKNNVWVNKQYWGNVN